MNLLVIDNARFYADSLVQSIKTVSFIENAQACHSGQDGVDLCKQESPELAIVDIKMDDLNGFETAKLLRSANPDLKIVFMSAMIDANYALKMVELDFAGFLDKNADHEDFEFVLNTLRKGHLYISPVALVHFVQLIKDQSNRRESPLSNRELEILKLMVSRKSRSDIASSLFIDPKTVDKHRERMKQKLELTSNEELVEYGKSLGFIDLI